MKKKKAATGAAFALLLAVIVMLSACGGGGTDNDVGASASPSSPVAVTPSADPSAPGESGAGESGAGEGQAAATPSGSGGEASGTDGVGGKPVGLVTAVRLADFATGWTGGRGWIARTDDSGQNWKVQYKSAGATVAQIFALDNKRVWAALETGSEGSLKLIRSIDGGTKWTDAGTVPNAGFFHFVSDKEAFSGDARTVDGGKTWTELKTPEGTFGEAYFHDRGNGWALTLGTDKFIVNRTTDGGNSWKAVLERATEGPVNGVTIRSAGAKDAWVELIGDSGMTQTSYSLFHTTDGGSTWIPVLANSGAGSGPAPGYKMNEETGVAKNAGNSPGALYVVNPSTAFVGGQCLACDKPNTLGRTIDGGKTWTNLSGELPGYGKQLLAAADAKKLWWVLTDATEPSMLYTSSDGGAKWTKAYSFGKPEVVVE